MVFQIKYNCLGRQISPHLNLAGALILSLVLASCSKTLSGRLLDGRGERVKVSDGLVHLSSLGPNGRQPRQLVPINSNGTFMIDTDLDKGDYFLEALVPGYKISTLRFFFEGSTDVDLNLVPIENGDGTQSPIHVSKRNLLKGQSGQVSLNPPES